MAEKDTNVSSVDTCLGYTLGAKLGSGGFAFCREAFHRSGERVAIKFLKMDKADRILEKIDNAIVAVDADGKPISDIPRGLTRQLHEITTELMALQVCKSPNVVKLIKYKLNHPYKMSNGKTWNSLAMVLELCEHGELFDLVYHGDPLTEKVARTFLHQICDGLDALHAAKIAHRDIKPQNILLTKDFQCKLADLGSGSRFSSSRLMRTARVGTKGFQAPELLCGKKYSKKCDTFSLGVTLFVLMSKTMPSRSEATVKDPLYVYLAAKKFDKYWATFAQGGVEFSKPLCDLLQGMLAYQPAERMCIHDVKNEEDGLVAQGVRSHPWFKDEIFTPEQLTSEIRDRFLLSRKKRNKARNPEDTVDSTKFRSGGKMELPILPKEREFWVFPVDTDVKVPGPEGVEQQLHPDLLFRLVMDKFERQEQKVTADYKEKEGYLSLKAAKGDFVIQVGLQAYEKDGDYFIDVVPTENWHAPASKKLVQDIQSFLNIY